MKQMRWAVCFCLFSPLVLCVAQGKPQVESLAQLELTSEVATTTVEGFPSTLRITLKNVGHVAVDLPLAPDSCEPDGGIDVEMKWISDHPNGRGTGWGHGCGTGDLLSLPDRVRNDYIRLRPGEYFVFTEEMPYTLSDLKDGTLEYWVEFNPPNATPREVEELREEGFIIPTHRLETGHKSFHIR